MRLKVCVQPGDLHVKGDPERMHQVVANLLDNAVRHSPPDGRVWLTAHAATAARTRIEVADEGPGIAPHEAERVFERFYRADVARNGDGSGLGLAIARWIVDAHGGAIRAEARVEPAGLPDGRGAAGVTTPPHDAGREAGGWPLGARHAQRLREAATAAPAWYAAAVLALGAFAAVSLVGVPAGAGLAALGVALCAAAAVATAPACARPRPARHLRPRALAGRAPTRRIARRIHVQVAVGEKSHGIEGIEVLSAPLQRLFGNGGAVSPKNSVPVLRVSPEVVEGDHRGGDRLVLIALALPNDQEPPLLLFLPPAFFTNDWGGEDSVRGFPRDQAGGYHHEASKQPHAGLPKVAPEVARWFDALRGSQRSADAIKSRMNSAASWAC